MTTAQAAPLLADRAGGESQRMNGKHYFLVTNNHETLVMTTTQVTCFRGCMGKIVGS